MSKDTLALEDILAFANIFFDDKGIEKSKRRLVGLIFELYAEFTNKKGEGAYDLPIMTFALPNEDKSLGKNLEYPQYAIAQGHKIVDPIVDDLALADAKLDFLNSIIEGTFDEDFTKEEYGAYFDRNMAIYLKRSNVEDAMIKNAPLFTTSYFRFNPEANNAIITHDFEEVTGVNIMNDGKDVRYHVDQFLKPMDGYLPMFVSVFSIAICFAFMNSMITYFMLFVVIVNVFTNVAFNTVSENVDDWRKVFTPTAIAILSLSIGGFFSFGWTFLLAMLTAFIPPILRNEIVDIKGEMKG